MCHLKSKKEFDNEFDMENYCLLGSGSFGKVVKC